MKVRVFAGSLLIVLIGMIAWWSLRHFAPETDESASVQTKSSSERSQIAKDTQNTGVSERRVKHSVEQIAIERRSQLLETVFNEALPWVERVEAMKARGNEPLDQETIARLYAYLRTQPEGNLEDFYVVGNEIMEVFREQQVDAETYYREMLHLIENPDAFGVMRDYAIQHLTHWHESDDLSNEENERRSDAFKRILSVIERPKNATHDFAGTALTSIHLGLLSGSFQDEEDISKRLNQLVVKFARGEGGVSSINRLTALQVATEVQLPEAADLSREILSSPAYEAHDDLKLSAIASLGLVGKESDIDHLSVYEDEKSLAYAVRVATDRIMERSRQNANN